MSRDHERWIEAFATLEPAAEHEAGAPSSEEIWDAAHGTLPPERTAEIIDLMAENPAVAEAWRLAVALDEPMTPAQPAEPPRRVVPIRRPVRGWMAAVAAVALMAIGLWQLRLQTPVATSRDGEGPPIVSLVSDGSALARDAFTLRWTGRATAARWDLRVTTDSLEPVAEVFDLAQPEHRVAAEHLAGFADGTRLLWQVVEHGLDGTTTPSETFAVTLTD